MKTQNFLSSLSRKCLWKGTRWPFCVGFSVWKFTLVKNRIPCSAIKTRSIFSQIFTKDTPEVTRYGEIWGVFCGCSIWLIFCRSSCNYTPRFNEVDRGVYWYHLVRLSVRPSVRLSVCGQNRVRSVSSTILIGSISYLHILWSNLRKCVACNARFKIQKFEILANFLNL